MQIELNKFATLKYVDPPKLDHSTLFFCPSVIDGTGAPLIPYLEKLASCGV